MFLIDLFIMAIEWFRAHIADEIFRGRKPQGKREPPAVYSSGIIAHQIGLLTCSAHSDNQRDVVLLFVWTESSDLVDDCL